MRRQLSYFLFLAIFGCFVGCTSTEVTESPKTAYVPPSVEEKDPELIWTSRDMAVSFDYLGQVKVRSWSYDGALERLKDAGRDLKADALIDIHFTRIGFLSQMQAFAVKFK